MEIKESLLRSKADVEKMPKELEGRPAPVKVLLVRVRVPKRPTTCQVSTPIQLSQSHFSAMVSFLMLIISCIYGEKHTQPGEGSIERYVG